jgi:hypothetical protein
VNRQALDDLKQQIPLLDYLQVHNWQPARQLSRGRLMGLCPLHADHKPSFLVDPHNSLFYCYGCGRGGDVIRFAELYHEVRFPQAVALLQQWRGLPSLLHEVTGFYRMQLHRHSEAVVYLHQRGVRSAELIEHMRIGYAPGGCLRAWLTQLGYSVDLLRQSGLVTAMGYDTYAHRVVFPLEENLYGRSISASAPPHRLLPGAKGGLYAWEQVRRCQEVILVEACSITPCCGKPDFATSPARSAPISMRASFANSVTVRKPSAWYSMPTRTAVVRRRLNRLPAGLPGKA